ncbi:phosphopantetheine-binding protein [Algoriphagus aquimarinus]|uniref:Acyl carrier protein n=1 Tax=Algoriphagus aquimarinus TaxID=237018 RepID=A0A1I0Y0J9_9BACT|nr:phosphopantetheine-binding protein [Algoriphagus aquimarinus]SFB06166.1 acyl carrier protein [Algoriphagus aquimarinus]
MTKDIVIDKINEFLVEEFEVDQSVIKPNASLQDTLELDSLDYVDLVVVIENNFGFKVTGDDFKSITTYQDFYDLIFEKVSAK